MHRYITYAATVAALCAPTQVNATNVELVHTLSMVVHGVSYHVNREPYAYQDTEYVRNNPNSKAVTGWNEFNPGFGLEVGTTNHNTYGIVGMYLNSYNKATSYVGLGYTLGSVTLPGTRLKISIGAEFALVTGYESMGANVIAGAIVRIGDSIKVLVIPQVSEYTTTVIGVSYIIPVKS